MAYKHLSLDERKTIEEMANQGTSLTKIAKRIGRGKSTVSRELLRNASAARSGGVAAWEEACGHFGQRGLYAAECRPKPLKKPSLRARAERGIAIQGYAKKLLFLCKKSTFCMARGDKGLENRYNMALQLVFDGLFAYV
ncbi:MAG: helix-turn-helix domain-containing protein [Clostridiales Family XIII bacterium]|nr:helix-turn-helix domain-containing protein [Clostridiales Family XIII bacterium]